MAKLSIAHWNDVYRVTPLKFSAKSAETIDVSQFSSLLNTIRGGWKDRSDGTRDGLSFFSGDLFSPSVESTVTRGSHMVPVMNELAPDVALTGNHDFDFGYPQLSKLVQDCKFPWILSNIIDEDTNRVPEHLHQFQVIERAGVRIGIIGLVEENWIATVSSWPQNFKFKSMSDTGRELSEMLRNPDGEYRCDLIIALSHCRLPNDIQLAKDLLSLSPSAQSTSPIFSLHGVDIILGGHDHLYFASKGVSSWEGYSPSDESPLGARDDCGDVLVVKSGMDFRYLSELTLELEDAPEGSIRRKVIKTVHGKRHNVTPDIPSSDRLKTILNSVLSSVSDTLKAPVCMTEVELNFRSRLLRTDEVAAANWVADVLRHAYDDALCTNFGKGSDGVLINAGALRGDSIYPPGEVTIANILEILPFQDPVVVIELDGEKLWDAVEAGLSKFPAQEGRFPVISGFRVSWDSRRPAGQRVLGIWLLQEMQSDGSSSGTPVLVDGEEVKREKSGRTYTIMTREYLAEGYDGYTALTDGKYLIDEENGQLMSALVRKYLLGSRFVNRMARLLHTPEGAGFWHNNTNSIIAREIDYRKRHAGDNKTAIARKWQNALSGVLNQLRSKAHYVDHINVTAREDMSDVDCFHGAKVRCGSEVDSSGPSTNFHEDLPVIHPVVDGRLKDEARANA